MELRRLRLLAELRRCGTIAAVAEAMSFSPSTVSVQLAQLQREAGSVLLRRVGRTVELTAAGERLADYADQALSAEEAVRADLASIDSEPQGRVRVSFMQTAGIALLPTALRLLADTAPRLRVELVHMETGPALVGLQTRLLDVVLGTDYAPIPPPQFGGHDRTDLLEEEMLIAVPPRRVAVGADTIRASDLEHDIWAAGTPGTGHASTVEHVCRRLGGFDPIIRYRSDDAMVKRALVSSGRAVTLLPALLGPSTENVAVRGIEGVQIWRTVFAATRATSRRAASVRAVRSALQQAATEVAAGLDHVNVSPSELI